MGTAIAGPQNKKKCAKKKRVSQFRDGIRFGTHRMLVTRVGISGTTAKSR